MSWLRLASLVLVAGSLAVKRQDFKTCEQSSFCKRHRAISENTGYEVDPHSLKHAGSRLDATLQNAENKLSLRIYGLKVRQF
ncbi:hypothetical protein NECAME_08154 [Necator americanus]|uniref:Uncharacterized protein n=1 Tax=Necator americanus TaxID=51031 RepID=W2TKF1_NECAM|nr:hypothetical protein NECAME_08154 [Necator americanus]ETN82104.1 hypothetical protein NECAME_08154 [Necator americanus]